MNDDSRACDSVDPGADHEFQGLLDDAYGVPPLPRSLLARLDRAIEAEWGQSPQLVKSPIAPWKTVLSRGSGSRRWLPVAASVAAVIALAVVFSGDTRAYGWAAMLKAWQEQGLVQLETDGQQRWLSLAEGLLGESTPDSRRLFDARRRVLLVRRGEGREVYRRRLSGTAVLADHNGLALAFLLGDTTSTDRWEKLKGLHVVDESWSRKSVAGQEQVSLRVLLQSQSSERFQLALTLDPQTQLPLDCVVPDGGNKTKSLAFTYPAQTAVARTEAEFPASLAVIEDDGSQSPANTIIADAANESPNPNESTAATSVTAPTVAIEKDQAHQPPMFGAPAKWRPARELHVPTAEVVRRLDAVLAKHWSKQGIEPAPAADDEELLRRAYLDLAGRTPSVNEVRSYLNDAAPNRYEALVDRLLKSPDHASHVATVWRTFLIPEGVDLARFGGVEAFDKWLAQRLASDDSYDEVVRSLLLAEGRLSRSGPLLFYSAVKLDADQLASRTARVFLGMRLECAQCHDHPFEPWKQQDFWSFAAFFARISRPQAQLETVSTVMQVRDVDRGEVMLPDTKVTVPPRFLNQQTPANLNLARREQLAQWLTSGDNPYFARATANRVWGHLFGKGIVDPIDDFGTQHAPKSPELLDMLAGHFIGSKFSLRELFRTVALSRAYRLSSGAGSVDERRLEWFAQMNVKTLTAEQVYDCITVATLPGEAPVAGSYVLNVERFGNTARDEFIRQFRTPGGHSTEYLGGIPQALTLMNGTLIDSATGLSSSGLLKSLEAPFFTNRQRIEVVYLATLSRRPRQDEWELLEGYIPAEATGRSLQEGLADVLWALLNSAEFTLNH